MKWLARSRRPLGAVAICAALVLGACGRDDNKEKGSKATDRSSTTAADGDSTETTALDGSSPTGGKAPATTAKSGSSATNATTEKGGAAVPDIVAVAPGRYNYTASGTSSAKGTVKGVPLNSSKEVKKAWETTYLRPKGNTQKATYSDQSATLEHILSYSDAGAGFTHLKLNGGDTFTPNPPARFVPIPATVGSTWSWTMISQPNSNGRSTTRTGSFKVERTETIVVGGQSIPVVVISGELTSDQPIKRTSTLTTYYSESFKLIVREREISVSNVDNDEDNTHIEVRSDVTAVLASLTPAN